MFKRLLISNQQFHENPRQGPPRLDLRKLRILDDADLEDEEDDEDLHNDMELE